MAHHDQVCLPLQVRRIAAEGPKVAFFFGNKLAIVAQQGRRRARWASGCGRRPKPAKKPGPSIHDFQARLDPSRCPCTTCSRSPKIVRSDGSGTICAELVLIKRAEPGVMVAGHDRDAPPEAGIERAGSGWRSSEDPLAEPASPSRNRRDRRRSRANRRPSVGSASC